MLHYQSGADFTVEENQKLLLYRKDYDVLASASSIYFKNVRVKMYKIAAG